MPCGYRYEILEGVLYMAAPAPWPLPGIAANVHDLLGTWVQAHRTGARVLARTGLFLDEINYLDPDLVCLHRSQIPRYGERTSAATLSVDVLLPSNVRAPREQREAVFLRTSVGKGRETAGVPLRSATIAIP